MNTDALGKTAIVCAFGLPICHGIPRASARFARTLLLKGKEMARALHSAASEAGSRMNARHRAKRDHVDIMKGKDGAEKGSACATRMTCTEVIFNLPAQWYTEPHPMASLT